MMMRFGVTAYSLDHFPNWDQFVSDSPCSVPFITRRWLEAYERIFGFTFLLLTVGTPKDPELVCVLPRKTRANFLTSPPLPIALHHSFIPSRKLLHDTGHLNEAFIQILREVSRVVRIATCSLHPIFPEMNIATLPKWRIANNQTIIVDLSDWERTWAAYNQTTRRKIRRTNESNIELHESDDASLAVYLHTLSYNRHKRTPPLSPVILQQWLQEMLSDGTLRLYFASRRSDTAEAMRVVTTMNNTVYDWCAGANITEAAPSASHWLVSEIQKKYSSEGFTKFDFMGANTPGISDFKKGFGGEIVQYNTLTMYKSPFVEIVDGMRTKFVERRRRMNEN